MQKRTICVRGYLFFLVLFCIDLFFFLVLALDLLVHLELLLGGHLGGTGQERRRGGLALLILPLRGLPLPLLWRPQLSSLLGTLHVWAHGKDGHQDEVRVQVVDEVDLERESQVAVARVTLACLVHPTTAEFVCISSQLIWTEMTDITRESEKGAREKAEN